MGNPVFRRKIYKEILEWKEERSEKYALLIKGARRVGKSTIVEEFAKKEFKSYILIDFAHTSKEITGLFDDMYNLDFFFLLKTKHVFLPISIFIASLYHKSP